MRKNKPLLTEIEITDAGAEGKAVARTGERVVFVPYAMPGDVVDIQVTKKRRRYMEGKVVHFHKKSPRHQEPFCAHFGACGGCKWQHMSYEDQLFYKEKQVRDNLQRIGSIDTGDMLPILASEKPVYYRNKLEFTFSHKRWIHSGEPMLEEGAPEHKGLGFHMPGFFDKIEDIRHCYLMEEPSNTIRLEAKKFAVENGYVFYDLRSKKGYLRNLVVRKSTSGDWMVNLVIGEDNPQQAKALLDHLQEKVPQITSLFYTINLKVNDSLSDLSATHYRGKSYMTEKMEDLSFKVGAMSFYQTNAAQALRLYDAVRTFAALQGDEVVYDLYTGAGTIALFLARQAAKVVGIEYVQEAVNDAVENARHNNISNVAFRAGDMMKVFDDAFIAAHGHPDVIVTDPPRAGMHPDVVQRILMLQPGKIVYVSCNPATQARDVAVMQESYEVKAIQPVDMFPQTHHVENIILLQRRE
jgi:23S rRNA (uracil1939-C5)-methyltransferase